MKSHHAPNDEATPRRPRPSRNEWVLLAAIMLIAVMLRVALPSRMSVEHFDEGVYTSNLWFDATDGFHYPDRHLYAPPLLPALIEVAMLILGPGPWGAMSVGILAGCGMVGLIWWVAREWFGIEAGLAAALLTAFSDFHLLYSRTALTDVLLCLWMLLAVYLTWLCLVTGRHRWMVAAGFATGLAWWTKYNGWLPLAIGLSGLIAWLMFSRSRPRPLSAYLFGWIGIAGIAFAVWSPVLIELQPVGGYSVVAANHRQYLVGFSGWIEALIQQAGSHRHIDGWLSCAGLSLAIILPGAFLLIGGDRSTWNGQSQPANRKIGWDAWCAIVGLGLLVMGTGMLAGTSVTLAVTALVGVGLHLLPTLNPKQRAESDPALTLACWLVAAWFCGLLLTTPLYRPYPRLTLPWLVAAWLGTAALVGWIGSRLVDDSQATQKRKRIWLPIGAILAAAVLVSAVVLESDRVTARGVAAWQLRTGLEDVSRELIRKAVAKASETGNGDRSDSGFVIYVYGEPGLFFHLAATSRKSGDYVVGPIASLEFSHPSAQRPSVPVFLATGPHAHRSRQFADQWTQSADRFELVESFSYQPSDLVLLNEHPPEMLKNRDQLPSEEVRLYLLK